MFALFQDLELIAVGNREDIEYEEWMRSELDEVFAYKSNAYQPPRYEIVEVDGDYNKLPCWLGPDVCPFSKYRLLTENKQVNSFDSDNVVLPF